MEKIIEKKILFNSPLEIALRLLFIFEKTDRSFDLQRLIYYIYLIVHSSDIPNSPSSLHPDLPRRSCEMLVNRPIVKKALLLLILKDLISVTYTKNGIEYRKNENTTMFTKYFNSNYAENLKTRAIWLCDSFDNYSDDELTRLMDNNIGKWGSEFSVIYDEVEL